MVVKLIRIRPEFMRGSHRSYRTRRLKLVVELNEDELERLDLVSNNYYKVLRQLVG